MSADQRTTQQDAVITATLPHVIFDGWGFTALKRGAVEAGLKESDAERLFPNGARDAVAHFIAMADRRMVEDLATHDLSKLKHREKIALVVRLRLERWTMHKEAIRRALALSPLPSMAGASLQGWFGTVDAMWRAVGDKSVDFSFYTKRMLLAGVYGATLLYWLNDKSEDGAASWAFLDRRIDDVMQIPKLKSRVQSRLPDPRRLIERLGALRARRA
jgi:ubiquinone biosynthesis protein COQ9